MTSIGASSGRELAGGRARQPRKELASLGRAPWGVRLDFLFEQVHIAKFIRDYAAQVAVAYQKLAG